MYQAQLKQVKIRLLNNETIFGDIVEQTDLEIIVQLKGGKHIRLMRPGIMYIENV